MRVGISKKGLTQTPKKKKKTKQKKNLRSIDRSMPNTFPLVFLRPEKNAASQTLSAFLPASNCIALLLLLLSKEISSVAGLIFFL
jgi:hypothetical protein